MATYRDQAGKTWIFVGDIGDNYRGRPSIQVYQIEEPALPPLDQASKEIESGKPVIWHLMYPGGPQDSESLLVHPKTGRLYVVTKNEDGHDALYAFPAHAEKDKAIILEKVAPLDFTSLPRLGKRPKDARLTTAADFSPDGSRLLVATYSYLHEWRLSGKETLAEAMTHEPTLMEAPVLSQMEGVCYDYDGVSLWCTSERLPTPLYRIPRIK